MPSATDPPAPTTPPARSAETSPADSRVRSATDHPPGETQNGVLVLVVGPSGVGKDTLIDGAAAALAGNPHLHVMQRTITRPHDAGGENHEPMTEAAFAAAEAAGAFAVTWGAHDLRYGIRRALFDHLAAGEHVIANVSRRVIDAFAARHSPTMVFAIGAPEHVVEARLTARSREDASAVARRLTRHVPLSKAVPTVHIDNGGPPQDGIAAFVDALRHATAGTRRPLG